MTESRAFVLILIGTVVVSTVGFLGLAALGFDGVGMSLGVLIPLAIGVDLNSRVAMRHDEPGRRVKR